MTNVAQATYMGEDLIIQCDSRWDCCQREQAKHKCRAMNANVPGAGLRSTLSTALNAQKKAAQSMATQRMDNSTPGERAEDAEEGGAAPCLVKKLRDGGDRAGLKLEMDHPLDCKLGGATMPAVMMPLDVVVNNAFGGFAKNVAKRMAKVGVTELKSISLYCPPSYPGCPGESHSEGKHKTFPSHWWKTPFARMKGMGSFLVH